MRLLRFLISRTFWVQLGVAVVLGGIGFVAMNVGLRAFTRHSERIAVPEVVGLDRTGAAVSLEAAGLRSVVIDSLYNADGQPVLWSSRTPPPAWKSRAHATCT